MPTESRSVARYLRVHLALVSLLVLTGCDTIGLEVDDDAAGEASVREAMLEEVNALRTAGTTCGNQQMPPVEPLVWDERLEAAAQRHSDDMAADRFMSHEGSDGSMPDDRVADTGYPYRALAENVARTYSTVEEAVAGWQNSEGHCLNMMNARYEEMGAARADNFWTQVFGTAR